MLGNHGRGLTKALFTRPALALGRLGVTPNMLTVAGTVLSVTAAVTLLPRGHFVAGPLVLLVVLVADSFDGILARATGRSSVFGAFLDSTLDRLADGAIILGATVPYARARAESIGATAKVGIAERTDRLLVALGATFIVGLGAPPWVLTIALVYVAIASFITVVQRVWTVYRQTQRMGGPA